MFVLDKIIVFTGAGISAESGLNTFRDSNGLWENYQVTEVATPEAWERDAKEVLDFYNKRREQVLGVNPNAAHYALVELEKKYKVEIITQNIDDLHERAGSSNILHLHGEILKSRSVVNGNKKYLINGDQLCWGEKCEYGQQLRPDIVWFGEAVPNMIEAAHVCADADVLIVIGTSLNVYPAANIVEYVPSSCVKYLIDPRDVYAKGIKNLTFIKKNATIGVPELVNKLLDNKYLQ